jgi:hypothetical protein
VIELTSEMRIAAFGAGRAWADEHGHLPPDNEMLLAALTAALAIAAAAEVLADDHAGRP